MRRESRATLIRRRYAPAAGAQFQLDGQSSDLAVLHGRVPRAAALASKQLLLQSLKDGSLQIIDARSEAEHCGTAALGNKRAGAIPGAVNLDWVDLLDPKTQRFKSAAELRQIFAAAGIDLARPAAAHCQSGGRASAMVFALELMGAKEARNYYRSWAEWSSAADTPVVAGKPRAAREAKEAPPKKRPATLARRFATSKAFSTAPP